ncbi:MAG: ATP-grasp domain-containing protein [Candidatus Eremiobacteraeota bacterium]|nr:ATP-grasp domain-containing protein [Candidatus Eremiobacteraeota bacterium]
MSIRRLLVANRGEIAMRVIRAARGLGIETVLAASEPDRHALPARYADRTICIGPARASESYLRVETVVAAALGVGADAIHPGYGFLSENAALAEACDDAGIVFVGPTAAQVLEVGDKLRAREAARAADVPVTPGGPIASYESARELAERVGYPVLIKAVGGGGGRGMKRVDAPAHLEASMTLAVAEARAAFGDARLYLERFVENGRHIEVQVVGDGTNVLHFGERDCSIQRRYQKLLEEACAVDVPIDVRDAMRAAAVRFAARLHYRGAGTVEFLYDADRRDFSFLEMNARIQVEHPVSEAVTGVDLVALQLSIAGGASLPFAQDDVVFEGHAIECRINAEDPANDFRPSAGTIATAAFPTGPGIRVETFVESGSRVLPFYDSLIAKIVAHAPTRPAAIERMRVALRQCRIDGIATNLAMHASILGDETFRRGAVTTAYFRTEHVPSHA